MHFKSNYLINEKINVGGIFMKKMKRSVSIILTLLMVFSLLLPMGPVFAEESTMKVTILGTSDLHSNITNYDYYTQKPAEHGLAKVYSVVKEVRAQNPNTILIDNGDTIQGTPIAQYYLDNFNSKTATKIVHPMINVMNMMKYDAWTLGNHEFNYGIPLLNRVISDAKFPVLSANTYKADGSNFAKPYIIKDVNGAKIAILGFTTKGVTTWDKNNVVGMDFKDIVTEGQKWVRQLKDVDKVDAIIVSAHTGLESTNDILGENQATALATACPEITAILSGHAHKDLPADTLVNGVLIVQPGKWGQKVSEIDLNMVKDTSGKWTVESKTSKNIDVKTYAAAPEVLEAAKADLAAVDKMVAQVIGKSTSEFSGIDQKLKDTALVDLIQKVQMYYGKADISIAASFNDASRIPKGKVKVSDINALYVFENFLNVTEMTGKQLKAYIEYSAKYFNQMTKNGDTNITFDPLVAGYNYDMVQGVDYQLDLTQPVGSRLLNLTYKGKPVSDTKIFKVALNNYRFSGGGGHMAAAGITNPKNLYDSQTTLGDLGQIRTLIIKYIKMKKTISPVVDYNYNLITIPTYKYIADSNDTLSSIANGFDMNVKEILAVNNAVIKEAKKVLRRGTTVLVPNETVKKITLLSTNDYHGALAEGSTDPGIAKFATAVKIQKKMNPYGTILLSAGDMMQGTADSNLVGGKSVIEAMNTMGFSALEIGNHEFDWGTAKLAERAKQANFPFLVANMYNKETGKAASFGKPYVIVERNGYKVAIIGIITPLTATTTLPAIVDPYEFRDPATIVNALAKSLKSSKKADFVVVLGHLGAIQDATTKLITGEAADLANKAVGVDAIITGHSHTIVSGMVNNIPIVQAGKNGRLFGKIELYVNKEKKKIIEAKASTVALLPVALTADTAVKAIYDKYALAIDPIKNEILGTNEVTLTHNARVENSTPLGQWATDVMRVNANADIAFQNGGGLRRDMPAGKVTMGLMYEIMPFDNTIYTFDLLGSDVKKALEIGINSTTSSNGQFSGINVKFDSSLVAGSRITEAKLLDGTLLDDSKYYKVATNDFQATGGDGYVMFKLGKNQINTNIPVRDILVKAVRDAKILKPVFDTRMIDIHIAVPPIVLAPIALKQAA